MSNPAQIKEEIEKLMEEFEKQYEVRKCSVCKSESCNELARKVEIYGHFVTGVYEIACMRLSRETEMTYQVARMCLSEWMRLQELEEFIAGYLNKIRERMEREKTNGMYL